MKARFLGCCLLCLSLFAAAVAASDTSGYIETRLGENHRQDYFAKVSGALGLEYHYAPGKLTLDAKVEFATLAELAGDHLRLDKLLLTWQLNENIDLLLGKTSQVWGRLDELTALDFPFAEDLRWRYWDAIEHRKRSRWTLGKNIYWGSHSLTLLLFPEAQSHRQEVVADGWCDDVCRWSYRDEQAQAFAASGFTVVTETDKGGQRPEFALRWTGLLGSVDVGLSAYYGSDHWPRVERRWQGLNTVALRRVVQQDYAAGIDMAYSIRDWVLRGELAYRHTVALPLESSSVAYQHDDDGFIEVDAPSLSVAVEKNLPAAVRANMQYLYTDFGQTGAAIIPRSTHGATLFLEKIFYAHNIVLDNTLLYDIEHRGYYSRLRLVWSPYQGGEFGIEGLYFKGENVQRDYGYLAHNNGLNITFKHEF